MELLLDMAVGEDAPLARHACLVLLNYANDEGAEQEKLLGMNAIQRLLGVIRTERPPDLLMAVGQLVNVLMSTGAHAPRLGGARSHGGGTGLTAAPAFVGAAACRPRAAAVPRPEGHRRDPAAWPALGQAHR